MTICRRRWRPPRGNTPAAPGQPPRRRMQDISDELFDQAMDVAMGVNPCGWRGNWVSRAPPCTAASKNRPAIASPARLPPDELQRVLTEHGGDSAAVARHLRVSMNSLRSQLRKLHCWPALSARRGQLCGALSYRPLDQSGRAGQRLPRLRQTTAPQGGDQDLLPSPDARARASNCCAKRSWWPASRVPKWYRSTM